ncbi:hypothetical protein [Deinococcus peraridilitoris]|uniref:Uncharacterized protein n=1 Tax=Deinococcus peraridilitoris (strain DSM 19664 / LMG 22246 / CIP 109416 / KR-200) TaxID=937777 RepID=L0A1I6_DEIPD|nr:hypothetical protein [Deinococcus peraridilitoris]AFZ67314.1 hypothetical protein Deipe_1796 [Deinococcus peraridilitoris DSM 19664]
MSKKVKMDVRSRRGGSPLPLALLAAGAYYLWRNEGARNKVIDTLQNLNPGPQGNFERVGSALRGGVEAVKRGESPIDALRTAAQEAQQGFKKSADNATDDVRNAADDLSDQARQASTDTQDVPRDPLHDRTDI